MRVDRFLGLTLAAVFVSMALAPPELSAQTRPRRRGGLWGDWRITMDFNGREWESILSFSRDREGNRTGQWISVWGVSELKDVSYEDGKVSFVQTRQTRDGQTMTSKFTGSIQEGKLSGSLSNDRGELSVKGTRVRRSPRVAGSWETTFSIGDREVTNTLVITADEEGKIAVDWQSDRVRHEISDVQYERGTLTFKTRSKMDDREWTSSFEGNFRGDTFSGAIRSDRGERPVRGTRIGAPLVGTWMLDVASDRGERKQRLRVFPDMSALYGATPVEKVQLEDGKVSFKISLQFGDQPFEMHFEGKVEEETLTGEMTTSRGSQKITGKKVQRRFGRARNRESETI